MTYDEWLAYMAMAQQAYSLYQVWPQMGLIMWHDFSMGFDSFHTGFEMAAVDPDTMILAQLLAGAQSSGGGGDVSTTYAAQGNSNSTQNQNSTKNIWYGLHPYQFAKLKSYTQIYKAESKIADIVENPKFEDFKKALREYDVVIIQTHGTKDGSLRFADGLHKLSELNPNEISASVIGFSACNPDNITKEWKSLGIAKDLKVFSALGDYSNPQASNPKKAIFNIWEFLSK
jgi:hypothetical protein